MKRYQVFGAVLAILLLVVLASTSTPMPVHVGLQRDWSSIEKQLIDLGVIDKTGWSPELATPLNILWAFGLAQKSKVLDEGPMMTSGDPMRFASTGGWTLAVGSAMDHYSHHQLITLTPEQEQLVEKVTKNIYRPCCSNPAYFPDCNHGMAMLGLMEIMASEGATESELYSAADEANRVWFGKSYQPQRSSCSV